MRFGETVVQAIIRECREETGLAVEVSKLLGVFNVIDKNQNFHFTHVVFLCEPIGGKLKAGLDAAELRWINPNKLKKAQEDLKRILEETDSLRSKFKGIFQTYTWIISMSC